MKFIYNGNKNYIDTQKEAIEAIAMTVVDHINDVYVQHIHNWEKEFDRVVQKNTTSEWTNFLVKALNEWVFNYINPHLDDLFVVVLPSIQFGYVLLFGFKRFKNCIFWTDWTDGDRD